MGDEIGHQPGQVRHFLIPALVLGLVVIIVMILVGESSEKESEYRVVFADEAVGGVFTADLEGRDRQQISKGDRIGYVQVFGDGRYVAFGEFGSDYKAGFNRVVATDGSGEFQPDEDEDIIYGAKSSPVFTFSGWKPAEGSSTYLGQADTGKTSKLASGSAAAISDDGSLVMIERFSDRLDDYIMFAVDVESGEETRIGSGRLLGLSADGSKVLFIGEGDKAYLADTSVADSGRPVGPEDVSPALSPDGDRLVYVDFTSSGQQATLLDIESGDEKPLGPANEAVFSPDGESVLLTKPAGSSAGSLAAVTEVDPESGESVLIAEGNDPVMAPDGRFVITNQLTVSGPDRGLDFVITEVESGEPVVLSEGSWIDGFTTAAGFYEVP